MLYLEQAFLEVICFIIGGVLINKKIEDFKDDIILFRPVYTDEGNATKLIIFFDGQISSAIDRRNITTVRQALARSFALDLPAQNQILKEKLNRSFPLPFYLPDNRVFIPLKMRKARIVGDSTYGYVDIDYIKTITSQDKKVNLILTTGLKIPLCTSANVARNNINIGRDIANAFNIKEDTEEARVLEAVGILVKKIYKIEQMLQRN